mmetsp:Transcript_40000/g.78734  ORF Transcript_40000/g.78734 Transcript_40000/m.78734 type:complete len:210 (-) Transcript_40000:540-1169(-)
MFSGATGGSSGCSGLRYSRSVLTVPLVGSKGSNWFLDSFFRDGAAVRFALAKTRTSMHPCLPPDTPSSRLPPGRTSTHLLLVGRTDLVCSCVMIASRSSPFKIAPRCVAFTMEISMRSFPLFTSSSSSSSSSSLCPPTSPSPPLGVSAASASLSSFFWGAPSPAEEQEEEEEAASAAASLSGVSSGTSSVTALPKVCLNPSPTTTRLIS